MDNQEINKKEGEKSQQSSQDSLDISKLKIDSSQISFDESQFVVFEVGDEKFSLDIDDVLEITHLKDITRVPNSETYINGVINLRGRIHVVISLARKLNLVDKEKTDDSRIIIIESDEERLGMIVDLVDQVLKVKKNDIQAVPEIINGNVEKKYLKGVIPFNDEILMILDTSKIIISEKNG